MNLLAGMPIIVSPLIQDEKWEEREVRLNMFEQWKRWGLNFWQYRETELRRFKVRAPVMIRMNNMLYCSPLTYSALKTDGLMT